MRQLWRAELFKQQERVRTRAPPTLMPLTTAAQRRGDATGRRQDLMYAVDTQALATFLALAPAVEPWPHQHAGVCFMLARISGDGAYGHGGLFCDPMRMGKTMTVLLFILRDLQAQLARGASRFAQPYVIVCPKSLAGVWQSELRRMLPAEPLVVRTLGTGDHDGADAQPDRPFDILLTTYPSLRSAACQAAIARAPAGYRALFCDEGHELRNADTLAHAAILELRVTAAWFISGTPIHNDVGNLLAALRIARVPDAAIETEEQRRRVMAAVYLRRDSGPAGINKIPVTWLDFSSEAERAFYAAASTLLRAARLDWRRAQELYAINKLRQVCIAPALLAGEITPPAPYTWSAAALGQGAETTVRAMAVHMLTVEALGGDVTVAGADLKRTFHDNQKTRHPTRTALDQEWKLWENAVRAAMRTLMPPVSTKEIYVAQLLARAEARGEKVVVFSNYCEPLERIADQCRFRQRTPEQGGRGASAREAVLVHGKVGDAERATACARFLADPRVGVLLITLQLGGHGHDFTCANHVVFLDPWYNPQLEFQGAARVAGPNQTRETFIHRLALRDTIDADVVRIADDKVELAAQHLPVGQDLGALADDDAMWVDDDDDDDDDARDDESVDADADADDDPMTLSL